MLVKFWAELFGAAILGANIACHLIPLVILVEMQRFGVNWFNNVDLADKKQTDL